VQLFLFPIGCALIRRSLMAETKKYNHGTTIIANLNDSLTDFSDGTQESQLTSYPYIASY